MIRTFALASLLLAVTVQSAAVLNFDDGKNQCNFSFKNAKLSTDCGGLLDGHATKADLKALSGKFDGLSDKVDALERRIDNLTPTTKPPKRAQREAQKAGGHLRPRRHFARQDRTHMKY
eukprot:g1435.t1